MNQLLFIELNEVNFDCVKHYISIGKLENWKVFIEKYGVTITESENQNHLLEPWIQWPTIRIGKKYSEHKIFHLNDVALDHFEQHWEILEKNGVSIGAISPINAKNKTKKPHFWIPDPWVDTKVSGGYFIEHLHKSIKQVVNDNAQEKLNLSSIFYLLIALIYTLNLKSAHNYIKIVCENLKYRKKWSRAIILDSLLANLFFKLCRKNKTKFATLFLNGAAHIQHHYFFNSSFYVGDNKNPEWYIPPRYDPLLEILEMYDSILGQIFQQYSNSRVIICTGLRQIPCETVIYYWRLKNHEHFFTRLGFSFLKIEPRMSRDFTVICKSDEEAVIFKSKLLKILSDDGKIIFSIAERISNKIYISLTFEKNITPELVLKIDGINYSNFSEDVAFVAIKNGRHDGDGYLIDTNLANTSIINLASVFNRVLDHFSVKA